MYEWVHGDAPINISRFHKIVGRLEFFQYRMLHLLGLIADIDLMHVYILSVTFLTFALIL